MVILAFDTALAACSVAVWSDGKTLAQTRQLMERGQAEHLIPMIAAAMAAAGIGFEALDRIAVTIGPGSFTGVRVALATARGLALARNIPVIGLTTGEVLAAGVAERAGIPAAIVSLIDSKRGDVYAESFTGAGEPLGPAVSISGRDVHAWIEVQCPSGTVAVVGDGTSAFTGNDARFSILNDVIFPDAAVLAACASRRSPGPPPVPLYVRPPDVTMPSSS